MNTVRVKLDVGMWDLEGKRTLDDWRRFVREIEDAVPAGCMYSLELNLTTDSEGEWFLDATYERPATDADRKYTAQNASVGPANTKFVEQYAANINALTRNG